MLFELQKLHPFSFYTDFMNPYVDGVGRVAQSV